MFFNKGQAQRERFERMAESIYPSLFGTALRLTRDREDAGDLLQETLVRAYEAFERFDGRNFKAWMLRILTNLYINRYRRRRREGIASSLDEEDAQQPMAPAEQAPDRMMLDRAVGHEIEEALASIPESFRLAVILSDLEGLSYDEIAEITEVPVGTVRSRIARGRGALRQKLERYALDQGYIRQ